MKITTKILVACLPGIVTGALFAATTGERAVSKPDEAALSKVKTSLGKLPLSFEPNRGQTDPRVQFVSRGPGYTVYFTKEETVLTLKDTKTSDAVVRMKFVGGNTSASATPLEALSNTSNYFIGNDSSKWVTGVAEYTKLRYEDIYPGVDVLYQGDHRQLRYDFIVKPGASAAAIQMAFEGADNIAITKDGDLALTIKGKTLITKKPFTYQEDGGAKKEVASHYVLKDGRVTFELAQYDNTKNVIIDPTVQFVTFLGGLLNDSVNGVAILNPNQSPSAQPSAYFVAGTTNSLNFPATVGLAAPLTSTSVGANDVYVTKLSFNGGSILWSTYIGGNSNDSGNAIAIDTVTPACQQQGCPIVVGQTYSANFPVAPYATPSLSGTNDAFAAKLNTNGSALIYSVYIGGITTDTATGVVVNNGSAYPQSTTGTPTTAINNCFASPQPSNCGDVWIGGYTDSPYFFCPGGFPPSNGAGTGITNCTNSNHNGQTTSSDAFIVKIPASFPTGYTAGAVLPFPSTLYGGFGEDRANAIAFNVINNMVYIAGDTTTAPQNFIQTSPATLTTVLPGITNNTANQYLVGGVATGLPGPGPQARGGFVAAFDAATFIQTFGSYVAVSPATGTCTVPGALGFATNCNQGTEVITGIAAEGGAPVSGCNLSTGACTATSTPTAAANPVRATYGNVGHIYITGDTTSHVPTANIAVNVTAFACQSPLIAASTAPGTYLGPNGTQIVTPFGGYTIPSGCTTAAVTQAPYNNNFAKTTTCAYPLALTQVGGAAYNLNQPTAGCNLAAFVAVLDGALLPQPVVGAAVPGIGNQIEYWAYYSSVQDTGVAGANRYNPGNSSTMAAAIAIDTNPTTLNSIYTLGTYQQMYITGSTTLTTTGAANQLPTTNNTTNPQEIFTLFNAATSNGGGVGGWNLTGNMNNLNETDAYVARFNPNGVVASAYGGLINNQNGLNGNTADRSPILHVPQLNFAEFIYDANLNDSLLLTANGVTPNTAGFAIAVDPTRAAIVGGSTNIIQGATGASSPGAISPAKACTGNTSNGCNFTTTNNLSYSGTTSGTTNVNSGLVANTGGQNSGGNDGWVSVLFFNDILVDAPSVSTANPFLQPGFPQNTLNNSYIETTPPPFGPTFDFAISDLSTQTQTFRVLFTGQAAGTLTNQTPWFVPLDNRYGSTATWNFNGNPGSAVVYYLPCLGVPPTQAVGAATATASAGYYNNAYPAPGGAYGPASCTRPNPDLYPLIPTIFTGFPAQTVPGTQGWLLVSQDINPGVVRLALDRRAAAGLLEGVYVAQFLVSTWDSQNTTQWPPCGNGSPNPNCSSQVTALPADNASVLVTVRLVVRPSIFLSRNAGILTGATGIFAANLPGINPLFANLVNGPGFAATIPQGTSLVPDWLFSGIDNSTVTTLTGTNGINSGPAVCNPTGIVAGFTTTVPGNGPFTGPNVQVPCLATGTGAGSPATPQGTPFATPSTPGFPAAAGTLINSAPFVIGNVGTTGIGLGYGATAYALNGPGDFSGQPNVSYAPGSFPPVYSPGLPNLISAPTASTPSINYYYDSGTVQTPSLATQLGYPLCRPDAPGFAACIATLGTPEPNTARNNLSFPYGSNQGGQDPPTQRNDATVHDYYISAEGGATISVEAINCSNMTAGGNWLGVQIAGTGPYVPICTNHTINTVGTVQAPAFSSTVITNDPGVNGGGQKIALDFKVFAFTDRSALNGIPTGTYSAQVYVWSSRAKNTVPGYCLGANITALSNGCQPGAASSTNPYPEVQVTQQQMFNVNLFVNDTTQVIQITSTCPSGGINPGQTVPLFATVNNSENDNTGNPIPAFGAGAIPNYPSFGNNGSVGGQNVVWSLVPFGPSSGQTQAQLDSCTPPTNAQSIANVGSLSSVGPIASTTFVAAASFGNSPNGQVTIYACRPTVAPAFQASPLYMYDATKATPPYPLTAGQTAAAPGIPTIDSVVCSLNNNGTGGTVLNMSASKVGVLRSNVFNFDSNGNGQGPAPNDPADRVDSFAPPGGVQAGDVAITGDWTGDGHAKAGWYRAGTWYLDANNNGVLDSGPGDLVYTGFGGPNDVPVVGDWGGLGRATIGIVTGGYLWVVDTTGTGVFQQPTPVCTPLTANTPTYPNCGTDTVTFTGKTSVFPWGGSTADVPVVGNWFGKVSTAGYPMAQAGFVRGGVAGYGPFLWVLDSGVAGSLNPTLGINVITPIPTAASYCISTAAPFTTQAPSSTNTCPTGFTLSTPPSSLATGWSSTWAYSANDVVLYQGTFYISQCPTTNTPFGTQCPQVAYNLNHLPSAGLPWMPITMPLGTQASAHAIGNGVGTAFGGIVGDIPVSGDWYNTGYSQFGDYRAATPGNSQQYLWVLDSAAATAPQVQHTPGLVFAYGGAAGDKPIVGRW